MNRFIKIFFVLFLFISCSGGGDDLSSEVGDDVKSIKVTMSTVYLELESEIVFQVFSDKNKILTSESTFFVNNQEISGNSYRGTQEGGFTVNAKYGQLTSPTKTFDVIPEIVYYQANVLVEDYTGTWCGWCPRVSEAIRLLKQESDKISVVAIHVGDNMEIAAANTLTSTFGVNSYPHVKLNRNSKWEGDQPNTLSVVTNLTNSPKKLGLALESTLDKRTLSLKTKVQFGFPYNDLKLVVYILENGIIADQTNFTSYFSDLEVYTAGNGNPISKGFTHDNVLRKSLTAVLGDNISSSSSKSGNTYEKTFSYEIPAGFDVTDMEIVAFVVDKDKKAINSRMSKFEKIQTFEKKE